MYIQNNSNCKQLVSMTTDNISPIRLTQILLIHGYFRDIQTNINNKTQAIISKFPLELIFLCFDFYILSTPHFICFSHLNQNKSNSKKKKHTNLSTTINQNKLEIMEFMTFQKGNILYPIKQTIKLPQTMKNIKSDNDTLCYVPNISDVSQEININTPAIIRCGQIQSNDICSLPKLSLFSGRSENRNYSKSSSTDHCSGIIFNRSSNNVLHGIEMDLPSFNYSVCDDMIYTPNKGLIAYQSFDYGSSNKLFYLNSKQSEWKLLTKISWRSLSPALLCNLTERNKLFITTKAGESVIFDYDRNQWQRTENMTDIIMKKSNSDLHCLCYNQAFNSLYRGINGNKYYKYSFHKNKWQYLANMDMFKINKNMDLNKLSANSIGNILNNTINSKSHYVSSQVLFNNPQQPHVINTVFNVTKSKYNYYDSNSTSKANIFTAYFDERDHSQKWVILSADINNHYSVQSMFI